MDETQESEIIFEQNEFDFEEEWSYDKWSNKELDKTSSYKSIVTSSQHLKDSDDIKTILSISSDQEENIKSFKLKSLENVRLSKLRENILKQAELRFSNLYKFYPVPKDPGLEAAFWILYPNPPLYKADGIEKFFQLAKVHNLQPINVLKKQLKSDEVNLKYYYADSKVLQALLEAMLQNPTVKTLNLQENFLTIDTCFYLNKLLMQNTVLKSLNLTSCKIGKNGALRLEAGISYSSALRDLNLTLCDLKKEGLYYIVNAVTANTLLQSLNISNNNLDSDSAIYIEKLISQTQSLISLNLSWNNFNSNEACEMIFKSLAENLTILDIDLSWNSLNKSSFPYISQCITENRFLTRLNLTANRFTHGDGLRIAKSLVTNRCLEELLLGKNPLGSQGVSEFINILNSREFIHSPLFILDFGHLWATKDVLPVLEKLKETKPNLKIKIDGILGNYKIIGPNLKELFFKTANHEAMNCKKKKEQKNFGFFVLSLEDTIIKKGKFMELLEKFKIKISDNLAKEIMNQFLVTKTTVDQLALKESYKSFFPNVKLPESSNKNTDADVLTPSEKIKKSKSNKNKKVKGKKKRIKKNSKRKTPKKVKKKKK